MEDCMVYLTFESEDDAEAVCRELVEKKLVACANIFPPMKSVYKWKGEVTKAAEVAVLCKTTMSCLRKMEDLVRSRHSYENPCLIAWEIQAGSQKFREWIHRQTGSELIGPATKS